MFKFTELIMKMAPIGVGAAMAGSIAEHGLSVLLPMAKMVGTLYLALFVFVVVVLLPAMLWAKVHIKNFMKDSNMEGIVSLDEIRRKK
jgi:proton glutamate symport protein